MTDAKRAKVAAEGAAFGMVAGVFFAAMQMLVALSLGAAPLSPFRLFASVIIGAPALDRVGMGLALLVGSIVHLALSGFFGWLYARFNVRQAAGTQMGWGSQSALGVLYGALLWLVNVQIIARILYPWFLDTPQFTQFLLHTLAYGLPLGLMYAANQRRIRHMRRVHA